MLVPKFPRWTIRIVGPSDPQTRLYYDERLVDTRLTVALFYFLHFVHSPNALLLPALNVWIPVLASRKKRESFLCQSGWSCARSWSWWCQHEQPTSILGRVPRHTSHL